jgi:hypothetical protein
MIHERAFWRSLVLGSRILRLLTSFVPCQIRNSPTARTIALPDEMRRQAERDAG